MTDIVGSLFGLSVPELQEQRRQQQLAENQNYANIMAKSSPAPGRTYNQVMLGRSLGQAIGKGLFGVQDPMIERATKLEGILKQTQDELGADSQDPVKLYGTLSQKLGEAGFGREASQATQLSQEAGKNQAQTAKLNAEVAAKEQQVLREQQGQQELAALYKSEEALGRVPTSKQVISIASKFMPAEKLVPLLTNSSDKEEYRNILQQQITQAHEDRLARIDMMTDQKEKDRQSKLEQLAFQRQTAEILKTMGGSGNKPLSGREARYADNVAIGANEAIGGINTIINLPKTVTGGFWGAGLAKMQSGSGLFEAPIGALKNSMTPEVVQRYNAEIANIGKNFSVMRNGGLASTNDDVNKFEQQYRINEGDKPLTAFTKLAQMRQFFERVVEIKVKSSATPPEQVENWKSWGEQVKEAIPLTVNDVNAIANSKDKTQTFKQALDKAAGKISSAIPQGAIDKLKASPNLAADFDAKFGVGASKKYLGGK